MSAYATPKQDSHRRQELRAAPDITVPQRGAVKLPSTLPTSDGAELIDVLIGQLAERLAGTIADRLRQTNAEQVPEWMDSRDAADYLGVHRDTLRKLAAERAIPAEQDGPGCKLFFRRAALDEWRLIGGRVAHLAGEPRRAA